MRPFRRDEFGTAFGSASLLVLGAAVLLQVIWLIARSEAWHVCVGAAGGSVNRRRLYRAASVGYLGNVFNGNFGLAVRIAALMSFTLVGPSGFPGGCRWVALRSLWR